MSDTNSSHNTHTNTDTDQSPIKRINELEERIERLEWIVVDNMNESETDTSTTDTVTAGEDIAGLQREIMEVIRQCDVRDDDGAPVGNVLTKLEIAGHDTDDIKDAIEILRRRGEIYEPESDILKVV